MLRLLAAWGVLFSHSFALVGHAEPLERFGTTLGSTMVLVFFSISGFLVRRSWEKDPRVLPFWHKRVVRLWPALIVVTVATALLLGPAVTTLAPSAYLSSWHTWTYPLWILLMTPLGGQLPGVFADLPQPHAVNGSLWSLRIEVFAYVLLLLLGATRLLRRRTVVTVTTAAALLYAACTFSPGQPTVGTANVMASFALGCCAYTWRDRLVLSHRTAGLVAGACLVAGLGPDAGRIVIWTLGIAYLSLWFAYALPSWGGWLTRYGDASYGLYICAFPVQQTIVQLIGRDTSPWTLAALATPTAWALALCSWTFVEQPALRRHRGHTQRQERAEPAFQSAGERFQSP